MEKEKFLKELKKNLRYLPKKVREEELLKYASLDSFNLSSVDVANKIYKERKMKIEIKNIKFLEAINIMIDSFKSKNKDIITKLVLFFICILLCAIFIKVPFIYARDMISELFNIYFTKETTLVIWNLAFEFGYAITAILFLISKIKNKAIELEKNV